MNRELFQEVRDSYAELQRQGRPGMIVPMISEQVGLCDKNGKRYRESKTRNLTLAEKPRRHATDFDVAVLAEAIIGRDWKEALGWNRDSDTISMHRLNRFSEESASPIGPSAFANVAAWSATVGALMQAQFIEGYKQAPYDLVDANLFDTRKPVFWQGGERYIDILGPTEPAPEVGVGEEHKDMSLSALWVEPAGMKKFGGKITVARETAEIDISGGQLLQKGKSGGESLKFRENELIIDILTGQTNNWKIGFLTDAAATGYNTYGPTIVDATGTSQTIPNDLTNPLNDIGAFAKSDESIANLKHPLTGLPIDVQMDTVIFPTVLDKVGQWLSGLTNVNAMSRTTLPSGVASDGNTAFPNMQTVGPNPWQGMLKPIVSKWLHHRHTASTTAVSPVRTAGLGLSGSGVYRWYRLDPRKFAVRRVMWEAASIDLNPNDYQMAVQNIIAGQVFNIAVQYQVLNPYAIQRNKGA